MQNTLTYQKSNPFSIFPKLILLVIIVLAVGYALSHATERHPGEAEQVRECLNDKGVFQVWMNPETGRVANVCQIDSTTFGIQIVKQFEGHWEELTGFVKSKMKCIDQVAQYLRNTGYLKLQ